MLSGTDSKTEAPGNPLIATLIINLGRSRSEQHPPGEQWVLELPPMCAHAAPHATADTHVGMDGFSAVEVLLRVLVVQTMRARRA